MKTKRIAVIIYTVIVITLMAIWSVAPIFPTQRLPVFNRLETENQESRGQMNQACVIELHESYMTVLYSYMRNDKLCYLIADFQLLNDTKIFDPSKSVAVGDIVNISYNGPIMESYPAYYCNTNEIYVIGTASENLLEFGLHEIQLLQSTLTRN